MKIKKTMVLIISTLFLLLPVIVEAKSVETYNNYDVYSVSSEVKSFSEHRLSGEGEHVGDNVCEETNVINALRVVGYCLFIAKIVIPFIIIGFGIFDLAKAVTGGDSDKVTKGVKTIGVRVLIGILVFALPSIINIILDVAVNLSDGETGYSMCQTCVLDPWACENGEPSDLYDPDDIFDDETGNITTTGFIEKETSSTHNAGSNATTTSRSTEFVDKSTSSTHDAGDKGTTTPRPTQKVEKQTSSTHTAGSNATTNKPTTKIFIQVED